MFGGQVVALGDGRAGGISVDACQEVEKEDPEQDSSVNKHVSSLITVPVFPLTVLSLNCETKEKRRGVARTNCLLFRSVPPSDLSIPNGPIRSHPL